MMISKRRNTPESRLGALPPAHRFRTDSACKGMRLVDLLVQYLFVSKEESGDLIDFGSVQVDGRLERNPARTIQGSEEIAVHWPRHGIHRHYEVDPRRILYRDAAILAYDKEAGVPSQQTPYDAYNNVFAAFRRYLDKEGTQKPYVALHHRLDQETSGVMVLALERAANRELGNAFAEQKVVKDYLAWASGIPAQESWVARDDIGRKAGRYLACSRGRGKSAETAFQVLHRRKDRFLVWARPRTGRTHQIRLHLAAADCPVVGDRRYGGPPAARLLLHAYRIRLPHPVSTEELTWTAPLPADWPPPRAIVLEETALSGLNSEEPD